MQDLIVVGAGPGGLAAAAAGRALGWKPVILEQSDRVGGAWARMPPDMLCLSPRIRDAMPDGALPPSTADRATVGEVLQAIEAYAERASFDVRFGVGATGMTTRAGTLILDTTDQPCEARRVIVATGEWGNPFRLPLPGDFDGPMVHTSEFEPEAVAAGERVCVIGAGNSGAEAVVALQARGAAVTLATRRPVQKPSPEPTGMLGEIAWRLSGMPVHNLPARGGCTHRTPLVDPELYLAVKSGAVKVVAGATALYPGGVRTSAGEEVACDRIVFATGFRRDLAWLGSAITLNADGVPAHDRGVSLDVARLGFVGIPCMRTRRSGFLRGLVSDAAYVARRLR